jgi:hypothetical protein
MAALLANAVEVVSPSPTAAVLYNIATSDLHLFDVEGC